MSSPTTPQTIGRFRVDSVIGAGGMGEVYKAFDPMLRRTVAIKMVRPGADNPQFLERLLHEAQACARLRHPSVVTVHEAGEIDGSIYMAMEFLTGENLAAVLKRRTLPFEDGVRILIQVLDALEHAHNEGVIHRDIKPANIQVEPDGTIKLVDFGLARTEQTEPMTATGVVMGTPDYASPEQLRCDPLDRRTDVFSMGVVAYEMIDGRRPFPRTGDMAALLYNIVHVPAPPMNNFWSREFPEIEQIVMRALAKSPAERFQTAGEMRDALRAFLAGSRDRIAAKQAEANQPYEGRTGENVSPAVTIRTPPGSYASGTDGSGSGAPRAFQTGPTLPVASTTAPTPEAPTTASPPSTASSPTTGSLRAPTTWMVGAAAAAVALLLIIVLRPVPSSEADASAVGAPVGSAAAGSTAPAAPAPNSAAAQMSTAQLDAVQETLTRAANAPSGAASPSTATAAPTAPAASAPAAAPNTAVRTEPSAPPTMPGAKAMFATNVGVSPSATRAGLRYRVMREGLNRSVIDVDPETTSFRNGERVRLVFDANIDGYLYVVQQGTSKQWSVLFPSPDVNGGRNAIRMGESYEVPQGGWFKFDGDPGQEQIFVFLSREPLNQLPGFDKPVTRRETLMASVVEDLQGRIRSRDLVFEKDETPAAGSGVRATYVVNRAELGQSVSASFSLNHAP